MNACCTDGFVFLLCAVCERTIDGDQGTVQSPYFPNSYPDDTYCAYRFGYSYNPTLEPGYRYVINFTNFNLESAVNGSCVNDYVEVGLEMSCVKVCCVLPVPFSGFEECLGFSYCMVLFFVFLH